WKRQTVGEYLYEGMINYVVERTGQIVAIACAGVSVHDNVLLRVALKRREFIEKKISLLMPHRHIIKIEDAQRGLWRVCDAPAICGSAPNAANLSKLEINEIIYAVYHTQGAIA